MQTVGLDLRLFPPGWRGRFPHMAEGDRPLWLLWMDDHADEWASFAYDVAVGGQDAPANIVDPAMRRAWKFNTAKRIDALGFKADQIGIFEVRPQSGVSAIGALLAYEHLLREALSDVRPVRKYLITDLIAADTQRAAEAQGITVLVYPEQAEVAG